MLTSVTKARYRCTPDLTSICQLEQVIGSSQHLGLDYARSSDGRISCSDDAYYINISDNRIPDT